METKDIMEAIDRIEEKMAATSESNKAELKRLGEEQTKLARQLLDVQQKGVKVQEAVRMKSAGEMFVESENFKAMVTGRAGRARFDLDEQVDTKAEAQNPITTPAAASFRLTAAPEFFPVRTVRSQSNRSSRRFRSPPMRTST